MRFLFVCMVLLAAAEESPWWSVSSTGVDANLRGVSVAVAHGKTSIWASGSNGVVVRSSDSGQSWEQVHVPQADGLDFRGVQSFDGSTAYIMSSGEAGKSRIYKTSDAGATWDLQYSDARKSFFLDALACSDEKHCFALSDPVGGKFLLLHTEDGKHWTELSQEHLPAALPNEGAFAASNSSLLIFENRELYFASGGGAAARVFHSADLGKSWTVSETPVLSGKASAGIFSIVRADETVVVVGGDYAAPDRQEKTVAYSSDAGKTWQLSAELPGGYRSCVETFDAGFVTIGPNGGETSKDGVHWQHIAGPNLNAITFSFGKGWAVGPKGLVAHFLDQTAYGQ